MQKKKEAVETLFYNALCKPQFLAYESPPTNNEQIIRLLKKSLFNELNNQIETNRKLSDANNQRFQDYLDTLYGLRFQKVRISLLLYCRINTILKYENNDSYEMSELIEHVTSQIAIYQEPIVSKDLSTKINRIVRNQVKYTVGRIRKQEIKKKVIKYIEQAVELADKNTVYDNHSACVIELTESFFFGCNVDAKYEDRKDNSKLFLKAYNITKGYIIKLLKQRIAQKAKNKSDKQEKIAKVRVQVSNNTS